MDRGHLIVVLPFLVLFGRLCRSVLSCRSILLLLAFLALSYEGCCQGKIRIMMHTLSSSLCRCHVSPLSKSKWTPKRLVRIVLQGVYGLNSSGGLYCEKTIIDSFLLKVKKENCLNEKQFTLLVHTHLQFCNNLFNIWLTLDTYCIQTSTQKNLSIIQFLIVFFIFVCYLTKKNGFGISYSLAIVSCCNSQYIKKLKFCILPRRHTVEVPVLQTSSSRSLSRGALPLLQQYYYCCKTTDFASVTFKL